MRATRTTDDPRRLSHDGTDGKESGGLIGCVRRRQRVGDDAIHAEATDGGRHDDERMGSPMTTPTTGTGGLFAPDGSADGERADARVIPRRLGAGGRRVPRTADGRPILCLADLDGAAATWGAGRRRYPCPVHGSDRQRSLSVDLATGLYYCHCCGASGRLRDYWDADGSATPLGPGPVEDAARQRERGAALTRADREHAALLDAPVPAVAAALLASLPALTEALRAPTSRGAAYLSGRGLDPALAGSLGAGYAASGLWPGDRPGDPGRVVYPLWDPCAGRAVSLLGRACTEDTGARDRRHRKLPGCPAGLWPVASYARAVQSGTALVLVEGPADALALLACPGSPPVAALGGTRLPLSLAALRRLPGVVLALDDDPAGRAATDRLRADLALLGVRHTAVPAGWLGGVSDPAGLAGSAADTTAEQTMTS